MINVAWPSAVAPQAEIWRILDLSGLTSSVRESKNYLKAGFVYVNGQRIFTMKETVAIGSSFRLELRFPNGEVQHKDIFLSRKVNYKPRSNQPTTENRTASNGTRRSKR
ncbi:MAG: hypothetical protein EBS53_00365 [Bacteroidetes bacterium]|nr:hypothetical protein [Bacteroidota bacterium]